MLVHYVACIPYFVFSLIIPFYDSAELENCHTCCCCLLSLKEIETKKVKIMQAAIFKRCMSNAGTSPCTICPYHLNTDTSVPCYDSAQVYWKRFMTAFSVNCRCWACVAHYAVLRRLQQHACVKTALQQRRKNGTSGAWGTQTIVIGMRV